MFEDADLSDTKEGTNYIQTVVGRRRWAWLDVQSNKTSNKRVKDKPKTRQRVRKPQSVNDEIPFIPNWELLHKASHTATLSDQRAHYLFRYERREDEPQHSGGDGKEWEKKPRLTNEELLF